VYWRCTPTAASPFLRSPVSSTTRTASASPRAAPRPTSETYGMVGRSPTWPCFVGTSMSVRGSDHPPYDCERKIELPIPSYDRRRPGPDVRGSVGGVYSGGGPPPQVPRAPGQPLVRVHGGLGAQLYRSLHAIHPLLLVIASARSWTYGCQKRRGRRGVRRGASVTRHEASAKTRWPRRGPGCSALDGLPCTPDARRPRRGSGQLRSRVCALARRVDATPTRRRAECDLDGAAGDIGT